MDKVAAVTSLRTLVRGSGFTEIVFLLTSAPVIKSLPLHLLPENQIYTSFFYAQLSISCILLLAN